MPDQNHTYFVLAWTGFLLAYGQFVPGIVLLYLKGKRTRIFMKKSIKITGIFLSQIEIQFFFPNFWSNCWYIAFHLSFCVSLHPAYRLT